MIAKIWKWLKSLFYTTARKATDSVAAMVMDDNNWQHALVLVKELSGSGLTNDEKVARFNDSMRAFCLAMGKTITDAAINALRENAVVAIKSEAQSCDGCCDR